MNRNTVRMSFRALLLALLPLLAAPTWSAEKARVITSFERATDCISKVQINSVDGKEVRVPPAGLRLEPGEHRLTGRAIVNNTYCSNIGNRNAMPDVEPLVAEFEAGKTYYVGYDHSSSDRKDWGLVIWKVKDD